jgi:hypothetical protein
MWWSSCSLLAVGKEPTQPSLSHTMWSMTPYAERLRPLCTWYQTTNTSRGRTAVLWCESPFPALSRAFAEKVWVDSLWGHRHDFFPFFLGI